MFSNFPFVCQKIFAYLKLNRPRVVIVNCYNMYILTILETDRVVNIKTHKLHSAEPFTV